MGILSYVRPEKKKNEEPLPPPTKPMEMSGVSSPGAVSGSGTPRYSSSRPASLYPTGDFRNSAIEEIREVKTDVMVNWLHQQQLEKMWVNGGQSEGVVLKRSRDIYACCPPELAHYQGDFYDAVRALNVKVGSLHTTSVVPSN